MSNGSSVVTLEAPNTRKLSLRLQAKKKRKAEEANGAAPVAAVVVLQQDNVEGETPLGCEKKLFAAQLRKHLLKARDALEVVGNTDLADLTLVERLAALESLPKVLEGLGGPEKSVAARMFLKMFTTAKWQQLQECETSIAKGEVRALRLKRHHDRLVMTHQDAVIDLTAAVAGDGSEEQRVVTNLANASRSFAERAASLVVVAPVLVPVPVAVESPRPEVVNTSRERPVRTKGKKREEEEADDDEVLLEEEEAVVPKKKNGSKKQRQAGKQNEKPSPPPPLEVNEDDYEKEDEDEFEDDEEEGDEDNAITLEMLELAVHDVETVVAMITAAQNGDEVPLKVGQVLAPDPNLALAASGAALLANAAELIQCLRIGGGGGGDNGRALLENWGRLLGWWRIVEQAFRITGVFDFLRKKDCGVRGKKLIDRYDNAVKGGGGDVFSFAQAARYDRLGRFLLQYPKFVNQLQFVTMKDWTEKSVVVVKGKGKKKALMDAIEVLLPADRVEFWKQQQEPIVEVPLPNYDGEVCVECNLPGGDGAQVWNCADCKGLMHEACIEAASDSQRQVAVQMFYCSKCIVNKSSFF